MYPAHV